MQNVYPTPSKTATLPKRSPTFYLFSLNLFLRFVHRYIRMRLLCIRFEFQETSTYIECGRKGAPLRFVPKNENSYNFPRKCVQSRRSEIEQKYARKYILWPKKCRASRVQKYNHRSVWIIVWQWWPIRTAIYTYYFTTHARIGRYVVVIILRNCFVHVAVRGRDDLGRHGRDKLGTRAACMSYVKCQGNKSRIITSLFFYAKRTGCSIRSGTQDGVCTDEVGMKTQRL